ncbi:MurR/RpiR family transcriptional regulator [Pelagibius sp. Alg239-R121]|uniref:MurR/RpiR family transcriptional regulator n=1 Tax=Pelagibius sp. Alg239-R121 TaxID=2993448 RepID=UPI0024A6A59B|nr:MurR/RpiR family transcriptional regulator [Pelagibius sp. Alg239-R121]
MLNVVEKLTAVLPDLPRKLETAAKFALDNPDRMAFGSMRAVASECGVSSPTMLRLARHMGFDSYEDFKATFQTGIVDNSFSAKAGALRRDAQGHPDNALLTNLRSAALENVSDALSRNDPDTFQAMAEAIRTAGTVHLIAAGSMYGIATHMETTGGIALDGLRVSRPGTATVIESLASLSSKDAVLAIAVSPYAVAALDAVKYSRRIGAVTMAITDRRSSPFVNHVDYCLFSSTESPHYHPSIVGVAAIVEALLAMAVAGGKGREAKRIDRVERLRLQTGAYIS